MANLFKSLFGLAKAKQSEAAEAIEDKNRVSFAKQDIEEVEKKLRESRVAVGNIKGRVMGLEREVKEKKDEAADRETKAKALKEAGKTDLAKQQWNIRCELIDEVETLKISLSQLKKTYEQQKVNVGELEGNLNAMKRSLQRMKTMDEVKKSNEAISAVDTSGSTSALEKFREREKKMQQELNTSTALMEEGKDATMSLDKATEKALTGGVKDSDGFDAL